MRPGYPVSTYALYRPFVHRVILVASFQLQRSPMLLECKGTSTESREPTRSLEPSISEGGNFRAWNVRIIWPERSDFHVIQQGSFSCRKSSTALLPFRMKACWRFLRPKKSDGFGRVWTRDLGYQRPACQLLDHRSHSCSKVGLTIFLYAPRRHVGGVTI
jgi:hypothetical protein